MIELSGIFPPIPTPFKDDSLSLEELKNNLLKWNDYGLSGYVVLGSNGENVMLNEVERLKVVETVKTNASQNKIIIAGVGLESTKGTAEFLRILSSLEVNAALVIAPHYYRGQMLPEALKGYYLEIAEHSPLPILIYNVPKFTGIEMALEVVRTLAAHENIIGIKDSSGNFTYQQSILAMNLEKFRLLTGTANTLMASLLMGAVGGILALANVAPHICLKIYEQVSNNNLDEARELQLSAIRLNQLTTGVYGVGGLKFALEQLGFYGGLPRRPLLPPNEAGRKEILDELKKLGLID